MRSEADAKRVAELAAQDPWARTVTAKRVLPATLALRVKERVPCARARINDESYIVDTDGVVVGRSDPELSGLPILTGLAGQSRDALRGSLGYGTRVVQRLRDEAGSWVPEIESLDLSRRDRVAIRTVDPGPAIFLDRYRVMRNLDAYLQLRREIVRRYGSIEHVDLRFEDRISVKPKHSERQVNHG